MVGAAGGLLAGAARAYSAEMLFCCAGGPSAKLDTPADQQGMGLLQRIPCIRGRKRTDAQPMNCTVLEPLYGHASDTDRTHFVRFRSLYVEE